MAGRETEVFVEVESDDLGEGQLAGAVEADQFGVEGQRGAAGGEAEDRGAAAGVDGGDEFCQFRGEGAAGFRGIGENTGRGRLGHGRELRCRVAFVKTKKAGKRRERPRKRR
jgi:hypothetical protein